MLIIDSQVHLHTAGKPHTRWRQSEFLPPELLQEMDSAGVDRAIIVPASWDANINTPAIEAAQRWPDRLAVMGRILLDRPDARAQLTNWKKTPGLLGIRLMNRLMPSEAWENGGKGYWFWEEAEKAGIPFMLHLSAEMPILLSVAERYPSIRFIIDHMGASMSGVKDDEAFAHLPELFKYAKFPNVGVKMSGSPSYSSELYPFRPIHKYLRQIVETFGASRLFWGTDLTRLTYWGGEGEPKTCSYRQAVTLFTEELPWLSQSDKEKIMGKALCDWLDWRIEPQAMRAAQ